MKLLSNLRFLFMIAAASVILVGCEDDLGTGGTGGGGSLNPLTLSLTPISETTIAIGDTFTINLVATQGDDALNVLEVFEDGVSIDDANRISYNGDVAVANPVLLLGDSKVSIDVDASVIAQTEAGTRTYRFTVTDDAGNAESRSIDITTVGTPPALTLNGTTTLNLDPGSLFNVNLSAEQGSGTIAFIGLAVDGVTSDIADLAFAGVDFTSNPHALEGDLVNGFSMTPLTFRAPTMDGSYLYTITLWDQFNQESTTEFTVNVVTATPLDMLMGVLFNAEGPAGTGGLDLDNGMSIGSSDVEAEIRDQGFDALGEWAQLIAPVNGSRLFQLTAGEDGVSESFTFASIDSKETLAGLNGSGFEVAISGTVIPGNVFLVERDGAVFAFEVIEVNVIQADNSDNYVVNIIK